MTLTEKDLNEIEKLIREIVKDEIKFLPTRDEFFSKMDEVMGELKNIRDEKTIFGHQVSDHEDRIFALEKIHPSGQHASSPR